MLDFKPLSQEEKDKALNDLFKNEADFYRDRLEQVENYLIA